MTPFLSVFVLGLSASTVFADSGNLGGGGGGGGGIASPQPQQPQPQYAEARDASIDPAWASKGYSNPAVTYSSGSSFYSSDPVFSSFDTVVAPPIQTGFGLFTGDVITTIINIILGFFAVALIMQIATTIADWDVFDHLFTARSLRSLDSDEMVRYANMAMTAIKKFEDINNVPK